VAGWAVGYVTKKVAKLVALVLGVFFILIQVLVVNRFLNVNWQAVSSLFDSMAHQLSGQSSHWWSLLLFQFPYAGSFGVGFVLGFRKG